MPIDNTELQKKCQLRHKLIRRLDAPVVVLETHGGLGQIWRRCYSQLERGVVFEIKPERAEALARQRPSWRVYESDAVEALRAGACAELAVNFLDVDPYGDSWPVIKAFFASERQRPARLAIAVNDGLRHKLKRQSGWDVASIRDAVQAFGAAALYPRWLEICRWLLERSAARAGYALTHWVGYHCGALGAVTHYGALCERR